MKPLFSIITIFFIYTIAFAQNEFITTWKTDNTYDVNKTSVTIPTQGENYNYDVDWENDGTFDDFGVTGNITHDYGIIGTYTIAIRGSFPRIYFYNSPESLKILSVQQWGNINWKSMEFAFHGCANLTLNATDIPNLTSIKSFKGMFQHARNFNGNINNWNTSNVENMSEMFAEASNFNQPLNNWDVSKVTDMSSMFFMVEKFNQPLNNWNVSNVTNMTAMFDHAKNFNQPLNNWNVYKVTNMRRMFSNAESFNQNLSEWNVSNVLNMYSMFSFTKQFNGNISSWNTEKVTNMGEMFRQAVAFNNDISRWDVSNVTNMYAMFYNSTIFNQDVSDWDTSNVTNMEGLFWDAKKFNQDISNWNVSLVTNMNRMFLDAKEFNQDISRWNVSNVIKMDHMFTRATTFNQDISEWDVSNVQNMFKMLQDTPLSTTNYDLLLDKWSQLNLRSNVSFWADNSTYCNSEGARTKIINDFGWSIIDNGKDCSSLSINSFTKNDIIIYPNPTYKSIIINNFNKGHIKIYNSLGQDVYYKKINNSSKSTQINTSNLLPGVYQVKIISGKKTVLSKLKVE